MRSLWPWAVALSLLLGWACHSSAEGGRVAPASAPTIVLPHGAPGIGFDDLRFSATLGKVLVPGGRSGRLHLIDPKSRAVLAVTGFAEKATYTGGHDDGVTSVDDGPSVLYATDRTTQRLAVIDPATRTIVEATPLAAHPDYVRWVQPTSEVWVTEPDADQLEVFTVDAQGRHPRQVATIAIPGGPESLVIDAERSRAYTHLWRGRTVAVDLHTRAVVARWDNGCRSSRGIALDASHGWVVTACAEGAVTVADPRNGRIISKLQTGAGVDVIDFDPHTHRVYVPSAKTARMLVAELGADGTLRALRTVPTTHGHCVTVDRRGHAYVCDPAHGRLLVIDDSQ